ncbi:MAG: hypothetical protein QM529_01405 [Hydrotalea sp.]|nr:hypothetical protein [Hydrotalea sp.]
MQKIYTKKTGVDFSTKKIGLGLASMALATLLFTPTLATAATNINSVQKLIVNKSLATSPTPVEKNTNLLAYDIDGKLMLTGNFGYIYNFAGGVLQRNDGLNTAGDGQSTFGYGASFIYQHISGFGIGFDYAGFNHGWTTTNGAEAQTAAGSYDYNVNMNVVSLVPSINFNLDKGGYWGLKFGIGVGVGLSSLSITPSASQPGASNILVSSGAAYRYVVDPHTDLTDPTTGNKWNPYASCNNANSSVGLYITDSNGWALPQGNAYLPNFYYIIPIKSNANTYIDNTVGNRKLAANQCFSGGYSISAFGVITSATNPASPLTDAQIKAGLQNGTIVYVGGAIAPDADPTNQGKLLPPTNSGIPVSPGNPDPTQPATPTTPTSVGKTPVIGNAGAILTAANYTGGIGFVLSPQITLSYDNGLFHTDINVKYIHSLLKTAYTSGLADNVLINGIITSDNYKYTVPAGPLAVFTGLGLGVNF